MVVKLFYLAHRVLIILKFGALSKYRFLEMNDIEAVQLDRAGGKKAPLELICLIDDELKAMDLSIDIRDNFHLGSLN